MITNPDKFAKDYNFLVSLPRAELDTFKFSYNAPDYVIVHYKVPLGTINVEIKLNQKDTIENNIAFIASEVRALTDTSFARERVGLLAAPIDAEYTETTDDDIPF